MSDDVVLKAIDGNFESVKTTLNWAILLSLTFLWAGWRHRKEIEAGGFKFERVYAVNFATGFYSIANLGIVIAIVRICELLAGLGENSRMQAIEGLVMDAWPLNPVAFFCKNSFTLICDGLGLGVWVLTWWLFYDSFVSLRARHPAQISKVLGMAFLLTSFAAGACVLFLEWTIWDYERHVHPNFILTVCTRIAACVGGIFLGRWLLKHIESHRLQEEIDSP